VVEKLHDGVRFKIADENDRRMEKVIKPKTEMECSSHKIKHGGCRNGHTGVA